MQPFQASLKSDKESDQHNLPRQGYFQIQLQVELLYFQELKWF